MRIMRTIRSDTEDLASVLIRFENGARGVCTVSQVSAGHKNGLELEVNGGTGSLAWKPGAAELSSGSVAGQSPTPSFSRIRRLMDECSSWIRRVTRWAWRSVGRCFP
jgi:predicted dehydrogenase